MCDSCRRIPSGKASTVRQADSPIQIALVSSQSSKIIAENLHGSFTCPSLLKFKR